MNCPEVGQKENEENVFEKHRQIFEEELIPNYWGSVAPEPILAKEDDSYFIYEFEGSCENFFHNQILKEKTERR